MKRSYRYLMFGMLYFAQGSIMAYFTALNAIYLQSFGLGLSEAGLIGTIGFIFSVLAEEMGFVGVVTVIGLFLLFLLRGLWFARDTPEMMGSLLATGVVTVLGFHIFVNVAITVGLLPVTGIPLPFLSYGRSFYLTTMVCVGILLNVPMRRNIFVNS